MSYPYPPDPDDWQTAYTRDQAYKDSSKYSGYYYTAVIIGFSIALTFILLRIIRLLRGSYFPTIQILATLVIVFFAVLSFVVISSKPKKLASKFFTEYYLSPNYVDPNEIIQYRLYGRTKYPPPFNILFPFKYVMVRNGELEKKDEWPAWAARHVGGPLLLIIMDGNALYVERGNRFSRVLGPGEKVPFLEWYETIKYVVDLRPKVKSGEFEVWTKDGIKIKIEAKIECRIGDPSKNNPTGGLVYPYDPVSVKKAVERLAIRWPNRLEGEPSEFNWIDAAWGQVTGIVPGYIHSRVLDDLFVAERKNGQILSPDAIDEITTDLNKATGVFGVFITDFQILKVMMPEEVYIHQKEYWKAELQSVSTIIDGQSKAFSIRTQEKARADAQRDLIISIADGLEKNKDRKYSDALLLSFSRILNNSLGDPLLRAYLANETLETLEKLQKMLE